ncbi:MAG: MFS transporter [Singulisphaera sp.]
MHFEDPTAPGPSDVPDTGPWYRGLNRYHWLVLIVAGLGWLFDTMDQQLFNLARKPAVTELLRVSPGDPAMAGKVAEFGGYATMIFMIGWAIGGLAFGILGDKIGRVKTMLLTILLYSGFTGLSALSVGFWDFTFYRFLTGLGVGGEFAVGVALVAEVMPDRARTSALGWLQAVSALGNMTAALISIGLGSLEQSGAIDSAWRAMFVIGVLPALLVIVVFRYLHEPERWQKAAEAELAPTPGQEAKLGSSPSSSATRDGGATPWSACSSRSPGSSASGDRLLQLRPDQLGLLGSLRGRPRPGIDADATKSFINGKLTLWVGITSLLQNAGAFFGIYAFSRVTQVIGRRPAFAIAFVLAMVSTALTFWYLDQFSEIFWMIPIMGFCQLSLFGGYAIYFPELFPTRLRSTGISFCYNVGRLVAAAGPLTLGLLTSRVFAGYPEPMRYAGVAMCSVFLLGLIALPFAPETKGKPLPE